MIPRVDCQSAFNLRVTALRVQFVSRRFADIPRLARINMVLRSLYGLWPDSWLRWLRVWVGRTSMGLNFKVFQNTNLLKSKDYILQLAHSEVYRRSSHPRLCSDCPIRNPSPANRATQEPPPQRTKRARRKSSGGAAVDRGRMHQRTWGRMHQRTWGRMHQQTWGRMHQQTEKDAEADCENSWHGYTIKNRGRPINWSAPV